jgi:DNA-binding transcriptional LysR family regulator
MLGHHCITQQEDVQDATQAAWLGDLMPQARIAIQTTSHEAAVVAAVHGAGLACLACFRAALEPTLRRIMPPSAVPSAGIWLVVHSDSRRTPRIRVVLSLITEHVRAMRTLLDPVADGLG